MLTKKNIIALIAITILPLLLILSEVSLRLLNYEFRPPAFGHDIGPEYIVFDKIGGHYRTKEEKWPIFRDQTFDVIKPLNQFRIFLLGGSSVYNLDGAAELKIGLEKKKYTDKEIRIINLGGNSYGTERLKLVFQELLNYSPDMILLYSGHNEFEEAYLKDTYFKNNLATKLSDLLLEKSRLFQFFSSIIFKFEKTIINALKSYNVHTPPNFPLKVTHKWGVSFDKPLIHNIYKKNVEDMAIESKKRGILLVILTPSYNRLLSPFVQDQDYLYYICEKMENPSEKKICLEKSLDHDYQPHRATETSNQILREISSRLNVPLIDIDQEISRNSKDGIPGNDLFSDHCHLNEKGNKILTNKIVEDLTTLYR